MYPPDAMTNPFKLREDQLNFVWVYYPEYNTNPFELFSWLYEMAEFRDNQAYAQIQQE